MSDVCGLWFVRDDPSADPHTPLVNRTPRPAIQNAVFYGIQAISVHDRPTANPWPATQNAVFYGTLQWTVTSTDRGVTSAGHPKCRILRHKKAVSVHFDRPRTTWTDARINPQPTDWRTHTQISRQIGGQAHRSTDRSADRHTDQPTDRRTDRPINRPIGGQTHRSTDRSADKPHFGCTLDVLWVYFGVLWG